MTRRVQAQPILFSEAFRALHPDKAGVRVPSDAVNSSVPTADVPRLQTQLARVCEVMAGGDWLTLPQIAAKVGGMTPALSARLRDMRNLHGWTVERRKVPGCPGLFAYRATKARQE